MSVLCVFGQNLRQLTARHGSIARVAADLGIGRVQFQRFLRGDAFPKPQTLEKMCAYFQVDARILLEPLDRIQQPPAANVAPAQIGPQEHALAPDIAALMGWVMQGRDFALPQGELPDGLYRYWFADNQKADVYHCMLVQIGSRVGARGSQVTGARSWRTYSGRTSFAEIPDTEVPRRRMETRGFVLKMPVGFVWVAFNPPPLYRVTLVHVAPNPLFSDGSFIGFVAWGRAELVGYSWMTRCYLQRVLPTARNILACARTKSPMSADQVPAAIEEHLRCPIELPPRSSERA